MIPSNDGGHSSATLSRPTMIEPMSAVWSIDEATSAHSRSRCRSVPTPVDQIGEPSCWSGPWLQRTVGYLRRRCIPAHSSSRNPTSRRSSWRVRLHPDLRRARRGGEPAQSAAALGRRAPGDHVAICMENHDRYFEVLWGCHYAGAVYTACSSRLTSSELRYIVNDCGAVVFITSTYKAEQAAEIIADTPAVALRLMLDGTIDGYESYEQAVAGAAAGAARRGASGGHRHALLVGHHGTSEGGHPAVRGAAAGDDARRRRSADAGAVRRDERQRLPVSGALLPCSSAAVLHGRPGARRNRRGDGALRRRAVPGADRAVPGDDQPGRADDVRAPAEARPEVRAGTTCRRCSASSTPRRRARSR